MKRRPPRDPAPALPPSAPPRLGEDPAPPDDMPLPPAGATLPATAGQAAGPRALLPGLHLVATPIGSARDITLRALDALAAADLLVAEDTRMLRHLMAIHGIALAGRRIVAYNDHSWPAAAPAVMAALNRGESVALCSDAGTPGIADPGFEAVRDAIAAGHRVHSLPGPSAAITALALSGLPTDRFLFAGFPPAKAAARSRFLAELVEVPATLILFESPRRVHETLSELAQSAGDMRRAAVCRELTKRFEEVYRGTLAELVADAPTWTMKGEFVIVLDRAAPATARAEDLDDALRDALAKASLRDAVDQVAAHLGAPRRLVYERALFLRKEG